MGSETEPAKLLLPYLQRADELHKHEPIVAYYCRLYAMERGMKIPPKERTVTTNDLLVSLMGQLEKDKKSIKLGPEDNLYVEGFASNVFAKADKQDRAGRADLNTAKTFYAASIFFEILNQFGELPPDIEQKQKYGVWKAAEIRKALKEGRRPEPGPPGGDSDLSVPSSSPASTNDLEPSLSFQASQPGGVTSPQQVDEGMRQHEGFQAGYPGADESSQHEEMVKVNPHVSSQSHSLPSSYSNHDYTSANFHQPPPVNRSEIPSYHDPYHHQSSSEQQPTPQNYYSHENPTAFSSEQQPTPQIYYSHENPTASYSYPNFQSYPSFNDSTFPTTPSFNDSTFPTTPMHQPSFYQGSNQLAPSVSNYQSTMQYDSSSQNGNHVAPVGPPAVSYNYDSNYQPPAEKIAEAHKAARFAVGALAFDEVSVGVDYLRRALELLTNPSAESH